MDGAEPKTRYTVFTASRAAVLEVWGQDGLDQVAKGVPEETRRATLSSAIIDGEWLPVRYAIDWHQAIFDGPARRNEAGLDAFAQKSVTLGFGRVQRVLLTLVTPATVMPRAAELWRNEHTHGTVSAEVQGKTARLVLREHPFTANRLSARVLSEAFRTAAALSRASLVTQTHTMKPDGSLEVVLNWK